MGGGSCRRAFAAALVALAATTSLVASAAPAAAHTPHDVIADAEFSPDYAADSTLYAISREWLMRSTDRGAHWRRLVRGLDNKSMLSSVEVSRQDAAVLYTASRGDGVYKSTDAGATWAPADAGLPDPNIALLALSPATDALLFAAGPDDGLAVTRDGGASWAPVPGVPAAHVTA